MALTPQERLGGLETDVRAMAGVHLCPACLVSSICPLLHLQPGWAGEHMGLVSAGCGETQASAVIVDAASPVVPGTQFLLCPPQDLP